MKIEALTPGEAEALLHRQQMLQAEAASVIEDLDLVPVLSRVGVSYPIGSFASGPSGTGLCLMRIPVVGTTG